MLKGKGRPILNLKYSDVYLDIEAVIFLEISEKYELFYNELKNLVKNLIGKNLWDKNLEIINEIFTYQKLRMPRINGKNEKLNFEYNIAEYLFYLNGDKKVKLKKNKNSIQTVNTESYGTNYWEFTRKKIIWARKSDKIKNEIDYDNKILEKIKRIEKDNFKKDKNLKINEYKINMFDELNKFRKYDSLENK